MTLSNSLLSFQDCLDAFDKALDDERGARVAVGSYEEAQHLRSRLHQCRSLDRKENRLKYAEGEKMHGKSIYDEITVKIRVNQAGQHYVYLEKVRLLDEEIEALSQVAEEVAMVPRQEVLPPRPIAGLLENFKRRV